MMLLLITYLHLRWGEVIGIKYVMPQVLRLYDVFYHMKKLFLRPETMPLIQEERLRGIEIPFVRCQQGNCPCPASQTQLSLSIQNVNNIQNLERIVLCFRRVSDTSNTAFNDRLCLRNGSDYEIKVEGGRIWYRTSRFIC